MRCYYTKFVQDIHFDKTRYQQFLRKQGLREHDIKHLNILFITNFTHAHFRDSSALADGGAFFQRDREYVAKMNEMALGLYRPTGYATSERKGGERPEKLAKTAEMWLPERTLSRCRCWKGWKQGVSYGTVTPHWEKEGC